MEFRSIIRKAVLGSLVIAILPLMGAVSPPKGAGLGLRSAYFKILSANGNRELGHGHYQVKNNNGYIVLVGRNQYRDGEYDRERDVLKPEGEGRPPKLVSFEHSFYNPNGSLKLQGSANLVTGHAICTRDQSGRKITLAKHMDFPPRTYAGATCIVPIETALKDGEKPAAFNVFDCGPSGPTLVSVVSQPNGQRQNWRYYPGKLAPVGVTANLGWFGKLINGLMPHRRVWFDPSAGWKYIGGKIQRYFASGPQVLLVRKASAHRQTAEASHS